MDNYKFEKMNDWEHECQKDYIYLLQRQMEIEQEWMEYEQRKPAKIVVTEKIIINEPTKDRILPF